MGIFVKPLTWLFGSVQDLVHPSARIAMDTAVRITPRLKIFHFSFSISVLTSTQQLPYRNIAFHFDIGSQLAGLLYPFALSFLMPLYVYPIVLERQERLREMMKMVRERSFLTTSRLLDFSFSFFSLSAPFADGSFDVGVLDYFVPV